MNILFDNQVFTFQKFGGISRYFYELMKGIKECADCKMPLIVSNNVYIEQNDQFKHYSFFPHTDFRGKERIMGVLNRYAFARATQKEKWDIVHPTYYNPYFFKHIGKTPLVVTVHDLIHEKYFLQDTVTINHKKKCITQADRIIAISENTKKDVVETYNVNPDKIDVIYHGQSINHDIKQKVENLPNNYILFVGLRESYKNFNRLAKAMSNIIKKHPDCHLVCTGKPFTAAEKIMFAHLGIAQHVYQYFVNEKELAYLYKNATAFAFPSEYEGFGIPILEAFACGCPVALSNASCFPEIAQNAGAYFDPLDEKDMERILLQLIENAAYREKCVISGCQRVKDFSWKKMVQETLSVYEKMI